MKVGVHQQDENYLSSQTEKGKVIMKDATISIIQHQKWFDAVIHDNLQEAKQILQTVPKDQKYSMVNGAFTVNEEEECLNPLVVEKICSCPFSKLRLPLHLSVVFCCRQVTKLLLDNGANELACNGSDNILHSCVIGAFYAPQFESDICEMVAWLKKNLDAENMKNLLMQENEGGLRPVEFAAQQGCLQLMKAFLCSYDSLTVPFGMTMVNVTDVSEYETGSRHDKSPLNMLACLDKDRLTPENTEVLLHPQIYDWIDQKISSNVIPLIIWALIRTFSVVCYFVLDNSVSIFQEVLQENSTTFLCPELSGISIPLDIYFYLLLAYLLMGMFTMITDLVHFIRINFLIYNGHKQALNGKKSTVAQPGFYWVAEVALCLSVAVSVGVIMAAAQSVTYPAPPGWYTVCILRIVIPLLLLTYVCYFLQMLPMIGPGVIQLQAMLMDMIRFLVLLTIIILPFVHTFETFSMANSLDGCAAEFSSVPNTFYTLFRMLNHMYDTTVLRFSNTGVFYFLHFLYIQVANILLINFLIAIMSNSALSLQGQHQKAVVAINRLSVVVNLESRIYWLTKGMYKLLRKTSFLCNQDKVYLVTRTIKKKGIA